MTTAAPSRIQPQSNRQHSAPKFSGDAAGLAEELRGKIRGEVRFDDGSRALYATDGSNYREVPIGVVVPRDIEDITNTIAAARIRRFPTSRIACRAHHLPLSAHYARALHVHIACATRPMRHTEYFHDCPHREYAFRGCPAAGERCAQTGSAQARNGLGI